MSTRVALTLTLAGLAVLGCGASDEGAGGKRDPRVCTQIACRSGVTVLIPERLPESASRIRACVAERCRSASTTSLGPLFVPLPDARGSRKVTLRMKLLDAAGRPVGASIRKLQLERVQPNGPGCPPVCFTARVERLSFGPR